MVLDKERFNNALFKWFSKSGRDLPWQKEEDPYRIFVAVVMLQQTQVATVIPYYLRFLDRLPDLSHLAQATDDLLYKLWEGLGYYSRARHMKQAASILMTEHGGVIPRDYETLKSLPGIGDYSAGAILSIAFQDPFVAIDGNLFRIFSRLLGIEKPLQDPSLRQEVTHIAKSLLPHDRPGDFNQALMDLGATICVGNAMPDCKVCPFRDYCIAHQKGIEKAIPIKQAKPLRPVETRTVFLFHKAGCLALLKRKSRGLLANMWEFPSVEGELSKDQIAKQMAAWNLNPSSIKTLPKLKHHFSHITWDITGVVAEFADDTADGIFTWVQETDLHRTISLPKAFSIVWDAWRKSE